MQDINNMRKLDNESALSCLLVGEPRKEWFWKPGQKPLPFRRDWIWMIRSEVELAQQHVSAVFYKVPNLQLAFVLDQFLACYSIALAQHVDHQVAEDEVPNQRRDTEVETCIAVRIGLDGVCRKHVICGTAHSIDTLE